MNFSAEPRISTFYLLICSYLSILVFHIQGWAEKFIWLCNIYCWWLFDQWDPSTATPIKEMYGPQGKLGWKINHICLYSKKESWSANQLLVDPRIYIYIYIKEQETTHPCFLERIIRIILIEESWPKRHFIFKEATGKNKKLALKQTNKQTKTSKQTNKQTKKHFLYAKESGYFFFMSIRI